MPTDRPFTVKKSKNYKIISHLACANRELGQLGALEELLICMSIFAHLQSLKALH